LAWENKIPFGNAGSRQLSSIRTAMTDRHHPEIDSDFQNDSPYSDYEFEGGLFAVGGVTWMTTSRLSSEDDQEL
jgi:hypothetical protein